MTSHQVYIPMILIDWLWVQSFGFSKYDSTVTHGFGPIKMTLDLYDLPSNKTGQCAGNEYCCPDAKVRIILYYHTVSDTAHGRRASFLLRPHARMTPTLVGRAKFAAQSPSFVLFHVSRVFHLVQTLALIAAQPQSTASLQAIPEQPATQPQIVDQMRHAVPSPRLV